MQQLTFDRSDRALDAPVLRRQESDLDEQQQGGVELAATVILHERVALRVKPVGADIVVDLLPDGAPMVDRPVEPELLDALDRAVEGDPGHGLGMDEMARFAANLPDAFVRRAPNLFEEADQNFLERPAALDIVNSIAA